MHILIFLYKFWWNIFHSKKDWARYVRKYILVFMQSILFSSQIVMKLEFSWQIFEKYSKSNFMKIRPVGADLFHAIGRTDGMTIMTKLIAAFGNFAKAPENILWDADFWAKRERNIGETPRNYEYHIRTGYSISVCTGRRGTAGSRTLFRQVRWTNKRCKSCKLYLEYSLSCDNSCIFQHDSN